MFTKTGKPKLTVRRHDAEEFAGVVERYGAGHREGAVSRMVAAANRPAEVSLVALVGVCGTCLKRAA